MKCPKCNGELIRKHGKHGDFLGCTKFPKCKHTVSLNQFCNFDTIAAMRYQLEDILSNDPCEGYEPLR